MLCNKTKILRKKIVFDRGQSLCPKSIPYQTSLTRIILISSSKDLEETFKFWALSSELGEVFLEVILKLQLKPPLTIPNSYLTHPGFMKIKLIVKGPSGGV